MQCNRATLPSTMSSAHAKSYDKYANMSVNHPTTPTHISARNKHHTVSMTFTTKRTQPNSAAQLTEQSFRGLHSDVKACMNSPQPSTLVWASHARWSLQNRMGDICIYIYINSILIGSMTMYIHLLYKFNIKLFKDLVCCGS